MTSIGPSNAYSFQQRLAAQLRQQAARQNTKGRKEETKTQTDPATELSIQEISQQSGLTPPPLTVEALIRQQQLAEAPKEHEQELPGEATEIIDAVAPAAQVDLGTDTYNNQPHLGRQMDIRV